MSTFYFNKIIILRSIKEDVLSAVATSLKQAIDDQISSWLYEHQDYPRIECEIIDINGLDQWHEFWNMINDGYGKGIFPIIHFVCHGSQDGMNILNNNDYCLILWKDVLQKLEEANRICHNNLFVTMCVCKGFWSLLHYKMWFQKSVPVYGLLASPDNVSNEEANGLLPDFYISFLKTLKIQDALQTFIDKLKKYYNSPNNARWSLIISDEFFMNIYKKDYERRKNPYILRKDAIKAFQASGRLKDTITEKDIISFVRASHENWLKYYKKIRDKMFMLDVREGDKSRYNFPETIEEVEVYHSIYEKIKEPKKKRKSLKRKKKNQNAKRILKMIQTKNTNQLNF